MNENILTKHWGKLLILIALAILSFSMVARNDAGHRTVLQYPLGGSMDVRFNSGYYFTFFARREVYKDYLTYDFTAGDDGKCRYSDNDGVSVRYQDGGEGSVCGIARIALPIDVDLMLKLHKTYRTEQGIRSKFLNQVVPKVLNLTAAQMTSEEAYATKRAEFIRISRDQAKRGIHKTKLVEKIVNVGVDENGKDEFQKKWIPQPIVGKDGLVQTEGSDFQKYGIIVEQFDVKAWDFEERTRAQISKKREAEQAIAIAKAVANKAYWAEQQVVAEGKREVANRKYKALATAETEIVNQNKEAQKAVILAKQKVEVLKQEVEREKQEVLKAKQIKLAADEQAKTVLVLATAEAKAQKLKIEADNALQPKLDAEVKIQQAWAKAYSLRKVPATVFASGGGTNSTSIGGDNEVSTFLRLKTIEAAKNLNYDRSVNIKKEQ